MGESRLLASICLLSCCIAAHAGEDTRLEGDAVRGKAVYAQCMGCHSPERHRTGPKHCGLIGRKAGELPFSLMASVMI